MIILLIFNKTNLIFIINGIKKRMSTVNRNDKGVYMELEM